MKTVEQWAADLWALPAGSDSRVHIIQQAMQSQHEATWAMAIEAADTLLNGDYDSEMRSYGCSFAERIRKLPCPPLTPNESE